MRASIVGAAGYGGGELLRLLAGHPRIELGQVVSRSQAGRFVHTVHPNLRGFVDRTFVAPDELEPCDVLFLALAHGEAAASIERWTAVAPRIVDLSADFRLRDAAAYEHWYGAPHAAPDWLGRFVYGLAETRRDELRGASYVSGVGCNATAVNLALLPLARSGVIERAIVDLKVGSSEGGARGSAATHHPERAGVVRSFAPTGHRHQAEVVQELGTFDLHLTATAVELVRGVLATCHVFLTEDLAEKDVWRLYREHYEAEPFVRIVKERRGLYRFPEPKILSGSNQADVGFALEEGTRRLVVFSAIDNLMKGAAGSAVQALNVMAGWPEDAGLRFPGLHPC